MATESIRLPSRRHCRRARVTQIAAAMLSALLPLAPLARAQGTAAHAVLVIEATGFANGRGHAEAKLFRKGDNVLGPAPLRARTLIHSGRANFVFPELPYGDYALVVFHDQNDNGKIDHNFLGLPAEALGFSHGFVPGIFVGMPSFEKLRFAFKLGTPTLRVTVK